MISALNLGPSTASGSFPVEATGAFTTNALIRGEASGSFYIKDSQVFLDDSENMTGLNSVRIWNTILTKPSTGNQLLIQSSSSNTASRVHQEPSGYIDDGTTAKLDFMGQPYNLDQANYSLGNNFWYNRNSPADSTGANGQNGVYAITAKAVGNNFGIWPTINIGFQDDNQNGGGLFKATYFDVTDTAWRPGLQTGGWRQGRAITSGNFILNDTGKVYQAASTGTTGSTGPTHTAGTVSDGGVDWTYIRTTSAANVRSVAVFGLRDDMPKFGLTDVKVQFMRDISLDNGRVLNFLTNASPTAATCWTIGAPLNTTDFRVTSTTVANANLRFLVSSGNPCVQWNGLAELDTIKTAADGSTTPSISQTGYLALSNTTPTNVTGFTGVTARQKFEVVSTNGNTTLVHSGNLVLMGGVNRTMVANEILMFKADNAGTSFIQVRGDSQGVFENNIRPTSNGVQTLGTSSFKWGGLILDSTVVAAGITGNATINKPGGSVNFAAAASTLVVTNSLVTADSRVFAIIRTNDTTAVIKNVIPAAGSFTIRMATAPTAETAVGFFVQS